MGNHVKGKVIQRPLFREEIKEALIEAIVTGELAPGDHIVETRLAKEYGVSQSPIREAIRELEIIGMIETIPYRGSFVRKIEKKDMIDIYITRSALESAAVVESIYKLTEDELEEMEQCIQEMVDAVKKRDLRRFVKKDTRFHEIFVESCENTFLTRIWSQCSIRDNTWIGAMRAEKTLKEIADHHVIIKNAIEERDEKKAQSAVKEHFQLLIDAVD